MWIRKRATLKFLTCLQILQEQQALLLEASPSYLAALSQDDTASCLNIAADVHDWELSHAQGTNSTDLAARTPDDAQGASMRYSRYNFIYTRQTADVCTHTPKVTTSYS